MKPVHRVRQVGLAHDDRDVPARGGLRDHPQRHLFEDPDGTRILFQSNRRDGNEIFVMSPEGTAIRNLTDIPGAGAFDPAWSPNGSRIAFVSDRDGNPEIYLMNADGSGIVRLTNDPAHDWSPDWSTDGSRIAYESDRDGAIALYAVGLDGEEPVRLTDTGGDTCCPTWRPARQPS